MILEHSVCGGVKELLVRSPAPDRRVQPHGPAHDADRRRAHVERGLQLGYLLLEEGAVEQTRQDEAERRGAHASHDRANVRDAGLVAGHASG